MAQNIIVRSDLGYASQFTGKGAAVINGKKKQPVFFHVIADSITIEDAVHIAKRDENILVVEYCDANYKALESVDVNGVYVVVTATMDNEITENDIIRVKASTPDGVQTVFRMPDDFNNIKFMCDMLDKYNDIRFVAKNVFLFDGYKFGYCGKDILEKAGVKYDTTKYIPSDGDDAVLPVFEFGEIPVEEVELPAKKAQKSNSTGARKASGSSSASSKPKAPSRKDKMRSLLFGGN